MRPLADIGASSGIGLTGTERSQSKRATHQHNEFTGSPVLQPAVLPRACQPAYLAIRVPLHSLPRCQRGAHIDRPYPLGTRTSKTNTSSARPSFGENSLERSPRSSAGRKAIAAMSEFRRETCPEPHPRANPLPSVGDRRGRVVVGRSVRSSASISTQEARRCRSASTAVQLRRGAPVPLLQSCPRIELHFRALANGTVVRKTGLADAIGCPHLSGAVRMRSDAFGRFRTLSDAFEQKDPRKTRLSESGAKTSAKTPKRASA